MEMGGVIVYRCIHNKYRDYTKKFMVLVYIHVHVRAYSLDF